MRNLKLFALNGNQEFGKQVAKSLDVPLSSHTERRFEDGEIYVKSDENVRGCDVYVISSLFTDSSLTAGEKLASLLFFLGSLSDASAARITVVAPYLAYARQDRKTESRAPITTKYIAKLLEVAGADRLLTLDVHNLSAFQNAFRIPTDNLEARNLFVELLTGVDCDGVKSQPGLLAEADLDKVVVLSPDSGGMSRCKAFRGKLEDRLQLKNQISLAYVDKERVTGSEVRGDRIVGDVKGKKVIVLDDMISTGRTIDIAHKAIENYGGELWAVVATHGLFIGKAQEYLGKVARVIITDTVPPFRLQDKTNVHVVKTAQLFASAIRRTHGEGGSISELLK